MRLFIKVFIVLLIVLSTSSCSVDNGDIPEDSWIKMRVDPTMELFCTIHRLANTGQDATNELPNYIDEIESYFDPFRNHKAVKLANRLWETHRINVSALTTLVVYLNEPPELIVKNKLNPLPPELDSRWTVDIIPDFIDAAREFSKDTKFMQFFDQQQQLYDRSVNNLYKSLKNENMLDWFKSYFGHVPDNYTIIIGMQNGFGNYGASITSRDGTKEYFSIIGAHSPFFFSDVPRFSSSWLIPIVTHEFCHPHINPLVAQHSGLLRVSGKKIFSDHQDELAKTGCLYWNHMMNEYIVRACVIRYLQAREDNKAVDLQIRQSEKHGFIGIRGLADIFEEYENNREKYPNIDSFFLQIAIYFEQYAKSL